VLVLNPEFQIVREVLSYISAVLDLSTMQLLKLITTCTYESRDTCICCYISNSTRGSI